MFFLLVKKGAFSKWMWQVNKFFGNWNSSYLISETETLDKFVIVTCIFMKYARGNLTKHKVPNKIMFPEALCLGLFMSFIKNIISEERI